MKLNHLNLTVTDVLDTSAFLEKYFGLKSAGKATTSMSFLSDDNGAVIGLMKGTDVSYPETFHIGFMQESEQRVNEIHQRLKDDGFDVQAPRKLHGSWTFYFQSPGGFQIEVLAY
jgi:lactoylglutathione lyase